MRERGLSRSQGEQPDERARRGRRAGARGSARRRAAVAARAAPRRHGGGRDSAASTATSAGNTDERPRAGRAASAPPRARSVPLARGRRRRPRDARRARSPPPRPCPGRVPCAAERRSSSSRSNFAASFDGSARIASVKSAIAASTWSCSPPAALAPKVRMPSSVRACEDRHRVAARGRCGQRVLCGRARRLHLRRVVEPQMRCGRDRVEPERAAAGHVVARAEQRSRGAAEPGVRRPVASAGRSRRRRHRLRSPFAMRARRRRAGTATTASTSSAAAASRRARHVRAPLEPRRPASTTASAPHARNSAGDEQPREAPCACAARRVARRRRARRPSARG